MRVFMSVVDKNMKGVLEIKAMKYHSNLRMQRSLMLSKLASLLFSPYLPISDSSCLRRDIHTYFIDRFARSQELIGIASIIYLF